MTGHGVFEGPCFFTPMVLLMLILTRVRAATRRQTYKTDLGSCTVHKSQPRWTRHMHLLAFYHHSCKGPLLSAVAWGRRRCCGRVGGSRRRPRYWRLRNHVRNLHGLHFASQSEAGTESPRVPPAPKSLASGFLETCPMLGVAVSTD